MKKFLPIGFIGGGNMAQALISGMIRQGMTPQQIFVSDPDPQKLRKLAQKFKISSVKNNLDLMQKCRTIVLATKPQDLIPILREIAPAVSGHTMISIAAGIDRATLLKPFKGALRLIRAMPNNPALIGEGITGLYGPPSLSATEKKAVEAVFRGSGDVLWVNREADLDAVTGVSGSGPAYVYRFVEALGRAGEKVGLPTDVAYRLALKTTLGAALTLQKTGKLPQELIPLVTSKKGTTLAGLQVMEEKGFEKLLEQTVKAATKRAGEIRKEFKGN
ncbi:MAG: pyrroline-5-carboxylate reductase [bacterium]